MNFKNKRSDALTLRQIKGKCPLKNFDRNLVGTFQTTAKPFSFVQFTNRASSKVISFRNWKKQSIQSGQLTCDVGAACESENFDIGTIRGNSFNTFVRDLVASIKHQLLNCERERNMLAN